MFKEVLAGIRDRVEGTLAVSLIGLDGIAIESIKNEQVPLDVFGAEFGGFVKSVRPNAELNTGDVLDTAQGKAEILLTPGVFLRVGDNSEVRMGNALRDVITV